MIQQILHTQAWLDVRSWRTKYSATLTPVHISVLSVVTPLTRLLEGKYGMKLDVHVHDQCVDTIHEMEASLLEESAQERCLRRKVSLLSRGEIMFDAESVLPLHVLPVTLMTALEEGKQPLANLLSEQGLSLSRSNLSITKIEGQGFYEGCWARRSVLRSPVGTKALVTEVFHESIWRKLHYLIQR